MIGLLSSLQPSDFRFSHHHGFVVVLRVSDMDHYAFDSRLHEHAG